MVEEIETFGLTLPDVQVDQQSTEFVAVRSVGVDFGGETGGGAILATRSATAHSMLSGLFKKKKDKTHRLSHLLYNPIHNRIAKPLIFQLQSSKISQRQPHPLAVFVSLVIAVISVVLIAMGVVAE